MLAKLKYRIKPWALLDHQWKCSRLRRQLDQMRPSIPLDAVSKVWSAHLADGLKRIDDHCRREGCFSWTSAQYQNDLADFLVNHRAAGRGIVEVGCYRGGLSARLAFIAQEMGWPFYTMDIDADAAVATASLLRTLGMDRHCVVFRGKLDTFAKVTKLHDRPALIVIDGDHRYEAVKDDIASVYRLNHLPHAAAFHDFSLRHAVIDERVDDAIYATFGAGSSILPIGMNTCEPGDYPTREAPSADGHYWKANSSEGAVLALPPTLPNARAQAA